LEVWCAVIRLHPSSCDCDIASLGAVHHEILRSRVAICRTRGGSRHMSLVLSHLSRDDLASLVSCFFSPMLLAVDLARPDCTSRRYRYRHLQADSIAATGLVNCCRAAMHRRGHRDHPQHVVLGSSWARREIPLLRCPPPHDANVASILPALPDAYLANVQRTRHCGQD
jgi:hypothetical protein